MPEADSQTFLDLTKKLDSSLPIFSSGDYFDPSFICTDWCSIPTQGFRISRLELGTQTGTHIDAPAHFAEDGAALDQLPVDKLIGSYFMIDLPACVSESELGRWLADYSGERMLFIRAFNAEHSELGLECLRRLLALPPLVWVLAGEITITAGAPYEFHRLTASAGKYLVEDLDQIAARLAPDHGEIIALPLRLTGTSGSPCRVVVKTPSNLDTSSYRPPRRPA